MSPPRGCGSKLLARRTGVLRCGTPHRTSAWGHCHTTLPCGRGSSTFVPCETVMARRFQSRHGRLAQSYTRGRPVCFGMDSMGGKYYRYRLVC
jgi:hypothetical protein